MCWQAGQGKIGWAGQSVQGRQGMAAPQAGRQAGCIPVLEMYSYQSGSKYLIIITTTLLGKQYGTLYVIFFSISTVLYILSVAESQVYISQCPGRGKKIKKTSCVFLC